MKSGVRVLVQYSRAVSGHSIDYDQSARTACGTRIPVDGIGDVFKAALVPHVAPRSALHDESLIS